MLRLVSASRSLAYVGTAGWAVPQQYRDGIAEGESILERYAGTLGAAEINSTFYKRHRVSTFERWRASVPNGFRFSVKLPRSITHEAALVGAQQELEAFFDDVQGLGEKLGPVLVQLPASQAFEAATSAAFFRALRRLHAGPVACEPRHASFYGPAAQRIFAEYDVARVVADPPRPAAAADPGGSNSLVYVRWHGSPDVYWSAYDDTRLSRLADSIRPRLGNAAVWCIFDNTAAGAAFDDARRFGRLLCA